MILALCYNRPSGTLSVKTRVPPVLELNGYYTFTDVINRVCSVCLGFLCHRLWIEECDELQPYEYAYQLVQKIEDIPLIYQNHAAGQILKLTLQESPAKDHASEHHVSDLLFEKSVAILEAYLRLRQLSTLSSHYWSLL